MLGNMSVKEIEQRTCVSFPTELVEYMSTRQQHNATGISAGMWHCFDIPFNLVCGDVDTAKEIYKHLAPLAGKFERKLEISIQK